jgi:hypothetical protein
VNSSPKRWSRGSGLLWRVDTIVRQGDLAALAIVASPVKLRFSRTRRSAFLIWSTT